MDDTPQLHPSIRINPTPRMTAVALAEYLVLKADPQASVLHDSRYSQTNIRAAYASARHAFRAYNVDPLRPIGTLNKVKDSLQRKIDDPSTSERAAARLVRETELIDMFLLRENALGLRSLPLEKPPKFEPLDIAGVAVSVQPDFLVRPIGGGVGGAFLRVTKAPDPDACRTEAKKHERGEHRREMARYMLALLELVLRGRPEFSGNVDRSLLFVSDVRLGERVSPGSDHTARLRDIEAACRQVAAQWDSIPPRPSIFLKSEE